MQAAIQLEADRAGLGVSIRAVRLGRVAPPVAVAPAFADADRARSDRRQAVTRAEEYRERAEADARGRSREIADRAAARVDRAWPGRPGRGRPVLQGPRRVEQGPRRHPSPALPRTPGRAPPEARPEGRRRPGRGG